MVCLLWWKAAHRFLQITKCTLGHGAPLPTIGDNVAHPHLKDRSRHIAVYLNNGETLYSGLRVGLDIYPLIMNYRSLAETVLMSIPDVQT